MMGKYILKHTLVVLIFAQILFCRFFAFFRELQAAQNNAKRPNERNLTRTKYLKEHLKNENN